MATKGNRRVKMTKLLLTESFLKFLSEKPLHRITIKEICEEADVNRSTYYAHYTDPYDQLRKIEAEIMIDMEVYVDRNESKNEKTIVYQVQTLKAILEYIQSKKHVFQVLLGEFGDTKFERNLLSYFGEKIFQEGNFDEKSIKEKEYQYIYAATGSFGMVIQWITEEEHIDIDTMAKWITDVNAPLARMENVIKKQ